MADSDLSLLFRLKGDNAQLKSTLTDTKGAVAQLRQSFGPELAASIGVGQKALQSIGGSVEDLISHELPVLGNVVISVSNGLRQVASAATESRASVDGAGISLAEIGEISGRTEAQVAGFVTSLSLLKTEAAKNTAVVGFLGGALASNLRPQLDEAAKAGAELNKILQASGKSTEEALRLVQALGLIGNATQRNAAAVAFFGEATAKKLLPQLEKFGSSLGAIAAASGRSGAEVAGFIAHFARLGTEVEKRTAAIEFFGASLATKLGPELAKTSAALEGVSAASAATGSSIAAIAGPIGIAVLALAAFATGAVIASKEIFELSKKAADFQGKLFDLSQQTGVSVETLSALEVVARTTGGSIDGVAQSLAIFQRHLEEAVQDRGSKAAITFHQLGVEARDTESALRQTIAAVAQLPEGFRQTAIAMELFGAHGRGGKEFLALIKESRGDIDLVIDRLKKLGLVTTDQAKIADEFNDQLVLLDIELRGLGTKAIPVVLDVLKDLSKTLEDNRVLFNILQGIVQSFAITLKLGFRTIKSLLDPVIEVLQVTAGIVRKIREDVEFIVGHPLPGFSAAPVALPAPQGPQTDPFTEQLKDEVEARKRLQAVLNFDFAKRQQQAQDSIALAQRELEAGKRTRQQLLEATIAGTRKQTQAQIDALQVERDIKLREAASAKDELQKQAEIGNAILAIDTQIANKKSEQARNEADLRAKTRIEEQKAEIASEQSRLDTLARLGEQRIAAIEDLIKREQVAREIGLEEIEKIENKALAARGQILKKELQLAGVGPDRQSVLDKIRALEADRTALERQQSERRKQITRDEFEAKRQILLSSIDGLIQVEQIRGNAQIAALEAQAALRIKTEEQAAKEILAIRLRLLDSEIEATQAKQKAAAGIVDPNERRATQAQLATDLKVLNAEREAIQADGNRKVDEGRQKDLQNERRYADELERIKERIRDIEQDMAEEAIRLLILNFAPRKAIIKAQRDEALKEEEERHQRNTEIIKQEKRETDERIAVLEKYVKNFKVKTADEIAERNLLIESLEKLRIKRAELEAQQDKEDIRSQTRQRTITKGADRELKGADPIARIGISKEDIEEFASAVDESIVPAAQIMSSAFFQVADAIGSVVQQWVLLGETGPAVMRKILAQALASIAAEAAVNAVKELALGFAMLFLNPADSAAHFTAAALWGSIAGVSAIAGRGIAGDLFKQKSATGGGAGSGREASPQALQTIVQGRNQPQPQVITIHLQSDLGELDRVITASVVRNMGDGGEIREVIQTDGRTR